MYAEQFWLIGAFLTLVAFLVAGFRVKWDFKYRSEEIIFPSIISLFISLLFFVIFPDKKSAIFQKSEIVVVEKKDGLALHYVETFGNIFLLDDLKLEENKKTQERHYFESFEDKKIDIELADVSGAYPFCKGDTLYAYWGVYQNSYGIEYKRKRVLLRTKRDLDIDRAIMMSGGSLTSHEEPKK